jgi:hypothetical protein
MTERRAASVDRAAGIHSERSSGSAQLIASAGDARSTSLGRGLNRAAASYGRAWQAERLLRRWPRPRPPSPRPRSRRPRTPLRSRFARAGTTMRAMAAAAYELRPASLRASAINSPADPSSPWPPSSSATPSSSASRSAARFCSSRASRTTSATLLFLPARTRPSAKVQRSGARDVALLPLLVRCVGPARGQRISHRGVRKLHDRSWYAL